MNSFSLQTSTMLPQDNVLSHPFRLGSYTLAHRCVQLIRPERPETGSSPGLVLAKPYNVAHWNTKTPEPFGQTRDRWQATVRQVHQAEGTVFLPLVYQLPPLSPKSWRTIPRTCLPPGSLRAIVDRLTQMAIEHYYYAAVLARDAGFDGIEIVVSPDSFIGQYLCSDTYCPPGASGRQHFQDRFRLLAEIIRSVHSIWNLNKVGVRLALTSLPRETEMNTHPAENADSKIAGSEAEVLIQYVVHCLNDYGLTYLHLPESSACTAVFPEGVAASLRSYYDGVFISQGHYTSESAARAVAQGHTDLIAFSLPDCPRESARKNGEAIADASVLQAKAPY